VYPRRVDLLVTGKDGATLVFKKRDVVPPIVAPTGPRIAVQPLFHVSAGKHGVDDCGNVVEGDLGIKGLLRLGQDKGTHFTEPMAPCHAQCDPAEQPVFDDMAFGNADNVI
jgi:hypothetical protein